MTNYPSYFSDLHTVEAIKQRYRDLAKTHHPDLGGDAEQMKAINAQYQAALKSCDGQTSDDHTYRYKADVETELMEKLLLLLKLPNLTIALIGYWIWVSGETRPLKAELKALGLQWHSKRRCWYYKPQGWKRTYQSKHSLSALAQKYGYKDFQTLDKDALPTVVERSR